MGSYIIQMQSMTLPHVLKLTDVNRRYIGAFRMIAALEHASDGSDMFVVVQKDLLWIFTLFS